MATLYYFSHSCPLYSPEIVEDDGICNICFKEEPVEFTCKPCNFDLCKPCSHLPQKVSHDFHSEHPLEFCLYQYDRKPAYIICSGCGNMSSCSFYVCTKCEIYLDLGCALLKNTVTGWDTKEMLHDSHQHLLRRCRPGPDVRGSCLLCEHPLSPSSVCYGCVYCYAFLHERCLDLPTEISHPVHPKHPLKRLGYLRGGGRGFCIACWVRIDGAPFGCVECDFDIHMRCADSLLRGLKHASHEHVLFYVTINVEEKDFGIIWGDPCPICSSYELSSLGCYYKCIECDVLYHFECLDIPGTVFKRSCHVHPLVYRQFSRNQEDYLEYCGVCETSVVAQDQIVYSCQECDFLAHIECILRGEEDPSPLYLRDLYSRGEHTTRTRRIRQSDETNKVEEDAIMINDKGHNHVMREITSDQLIPDEHCHICKKEIIAGNPWKCKIKECTFVTHSICAELGKPSRHPCHWNHLLTLAPVPLATDMMSCYSCRKDIKRFNLFCRICNFVIHVTCAMKGKLFLGMLGPKVIGTWRGRCSRGKHWLVQVRFTKKYQFLCQICQEKMSEKGVACTECETFYHMGCIGLQCTGVKKVDSNLYLFPSTSSDESETFS